MSRPFRNRTLNGRALQIGKNEDGHTVSIEQMPGKWLILLDGLDTLDEAATALQSLAHVHRTEIRSRVREAIRLSVYFNPALEALHTTPTAGA